MISHPWLPQAVWLPTSPNETNESVLPFHAARILFTHFITTNKTLVATIPEMSVPEPELRLPFKRKGLDVVAGGSTGFIFAVSAGIVVKIALQFDNPTYGLQCLTDDSREAMEHEKNIYKLLSTKKHPNFVQSFLCTPDGIFLPRMKESLQTRLEQQNGRPIAEQMQHRWIKQLASATVWLEQLDYFHGDMRIGNILLDDAGHVKLCDFGNTTKRGEKLSGAQWPYHRPRSDHHSPLAGPASEQFAMGSCIYTIRSGHEPLDHLKGHEIYKALIRGDFPVTDSDSIFGHIVFNCWHEKYQTMSDVEKAIRSALPDCECEKGASVMEPAMYEAGVANCVEFLKKEGKLQN